MFPTFNIVLLTQLDFTVMWYSFHGHVDVLCYIDFNAIELYLYLFKTLIKLSSHMTS